MIQKYWTASGERRIRFFRAIGLAVLTSPEMEAFWEKIVLLATTTGLCMLAVAAHRKPKSNWLTAIAVS